MSLSPLKQAFLRIEELEAQLAEKQQQSFEPIAIVGIGCRLPGGVENPEDFWRILRDGVDATREVPAGRWDVDRYFDPQPDTPGKTYSRRGGYLDSVDQFDAPFFKISPREAAVMDPQQRLLLEVAWEAFEHAGVPPRSLENSKTGVFVALSTSDYWNLQVRQNDLTAINAYHGSGIAYSVASGRISYVFGLQGPSISIDTACSGSLVAVHLACQSLRAGECGMALAGGVNLILSPDNSVIFAKSKMLASDGRCKTFDASADGFGEGEGCGLVVLKRLSDALADGSKILAVIRGSAVNQDGPSSGLTAPNGPSQEAVIRDALSMARMQPSDIGYVEAHGTGTSLGDPIEVQALAAALGEGREKPVWIGSVKTNLGHLEAAAGISGLIKVVLGLQHRTIPPHLHFQTPNPFIPWASLPVAVPTTSVEWPEISGRRMGGVSAFGFSGTNAYVILESAPAVAPPITVAVDRPVHILAISGSGAGALRDLASRYMISDGAELADICWSANAGRSHESNRLAIIAADKGELSNALKGFIAGDSTGEGVVEPGEPPKIAFLFTGQGAQYAGMGESLYRTQPVFREALDRCAEILRPLLDRPLLSVMYPADKSSTLLNQTIYTQPTLFALEYALSELWQSWGVRPSALLGHSLGEYVAAVTAGVWSLEDGLSLVATRARLMQELPAGGEMAAVFADEMSVAAVVRTRKGLAIAAVNGPQNVVISGEATALRAALAELKAAGVDTQPLTVSHAFHSSLIEPIVDRFAAAASAVPASPARIPIAANLSGSLIRSFDSHYWRRQMREPVRFADGIRSLKNTNIRVFLEIGPSPTLIGMGRRVFISNDTNNDAENATANEATWLPSLAKNREDWRTILGSLASLYTRGVDIDWKGFDRPYHRTRVAIPTYPFQRERHWFETQQTPLALAVGEHPLAQRRLRAAIGVFESTLDSRRIPWLADHRVRGNVILPATAYLEAARAASAALLGKTRLSLEGVVIGEALVIPDGESRTLQTVVTPGSRGEASFQIYSAAANEPNSWRLHASGRLEVDLPSATALDADALARCRELKEIDHHYRDLAARGIDLGPAFRGVDQLHFGAREAVAELRVTDAVSADAGSYEAHPALLDAALQAMGAALPADAQQGTFLPMGFDRVDFHAPPKGGRLRSHVRLHPITQSETMTADIGLYDEAGALLINFSGLHLKRMPAETLSDVENWMYEVRWQEQPLESTSLRPEDLRPAMSAAVPALRDRSTMSRYEELLPRLDAISAAWVARAFHTLGCNPRSGEFLVLNGLGIQDRHQRFFQRMLAILAEDGFIEALGADWIVKRGIDAPDPAPELQQLLVIYPEYEAEISLLARCGPDLAGVLRGQIDPLELLFPGGDTSTAERLYEQSPLAKAYNSLIRSAVVAAVDKLKGRKIRILEIGGGTGGTTSGLLPVLPAERTEYVFTDISRLFTSKASQKYQQYPFVRYRTLNVEEDPAAQGFDGDQFDIIVAANVLHATRDLSETMANVRGLLAPGGVLVALEMVRVQRDIDLVFGLTDGWWRFTDIDRRPASLLMSAPQWLELLTGLGFRDGFAVPERLDGESRAVNQAVLVAGGAASAWLLFEDDAGHGRELASQFAARGEKVVRARRGPAFASLGKDQYVLNASDSGNYRRLRDAVFPDTRRCRGIVHMWGLDAAPSASLDADSLDREQILGARSVLSVVQAFGGAGRLALVTKGAQAFDNQLDLCVSQAPVWGLAKVIALEHPELHCLRIDLDPSNVAGDMTRLTAELFANTREDQVMFRRGGRYVARLTRAEKRSFPLEAVVRYEVGRRGLLDSITANPMVRRPPQAGEVEIRVAATGLNMRDLLGAMGLYPGDPGPLGSECAGTITAVGSGVSGLHLGDEVLAIIPGCLASYVTGPADFVVRKPAQLTLEQAASVAIPYVTAHFALTLIARLKAGERVLIHSAAGGVGLAAIDLARRVGAKVVATAGNEEKRAYLRSLGIAEVLDSRSTAFASAISDIDVVLNSLGPEFVQPGLSVLAPGGRFIEIAKTGILNPDQIAALRKDIEYHVVDWSVQARETPSVIRTMLDEVISLLSVGQAKALPVRTFPAAEAVSALRFMGNARHIGKIVLVHGEALLRADATYLITGGLRGLGLLVAERFVERGAKNLVLMGRSPASPAAREVIAKLEARGARVMIAQADVAQRDQVDRELARATTLLPPLAGVIHSAGLLNDGVLQRLDWPRFSEVLAPKVRGTWNLYEALAAQKLDFFVCFSSIAGLFGSPGQANHAAANAFLDTFAYYLNSAGIPAKSINWGAWSEVGAAAERNIGERVSERGVETMTPTLGLDALERVMRMPAVQIAITPMRWDKFLEPFAPGSEPPFFSGVAPQAKRVQSGTAQPAAKGKQPVRERLAHAPSARRQSVLETYVSEEVARVLGVGSAMKVDARQPLVDMGLDSLMAVELRNLLGSGLELERSLPATIVYDYPSVKEMAAYLETLLPFNSSVIDEPTTPAMAERIVQAGTLANIEQLSDEEVDRLFAERVAALEKS